MQKQQTNREIMGRLGEEALSAKYGFTLSDDKYDMEKDAIDEDGNRVEIKTQNRHPAGYFTVNLANVNQLKKCVEVDRLLFLEYDNTDILKVWESPKNDKARRAKTIRTRDGRAMGGFPIDEMKLIDEIEDIDLSNMLKQLSQSKVIDV